MLLFYVMTKKLKLKIHAIPMLNKILWDHEGSIPFSNYTIQNGVDSPGYIGKLIIEIPLDFVEIEEIKEGE